MVSTLEYLLEVRGEPEYIRSDNGPEFLTFAVRSWPAGRGAKTLYIAPGSPWEDAYSETFNGRANAPNLRHFHTKPAGDTPRPMRLSAASP